jgi:hypothetical protein
VNAGKVNVTNMAKAIKSYDETKTNNPSAAFFAKKRAPKKKPMVDLTK